MKRPDAILSPTSIAVVEAIGSHPPEWFNCRDCDERIEFLERLGEFLVAAGLRAQIGALRASCVARHSAQR